MSGHFRFSSNTVYSYKEPEFRTVCFRNVVV
jgi:hypothetical protein